MDMLTRMMEMQEMLNTNVIVRKNMAHYNSAKSQFESSDSDEDLKRAWADNFMSALQAEVCEVREALTQRVKWWKLKIKDDNGVKEEMIDCLHFLMSGFLAMGMTAEDVYNIYCEKNKENFTRKDWTVNQEGSNGEERRS